MAQPWFLPFNQRPLQWQRFDLQTDVGTKQALHQMIMYAPARLPRQRSNGTVRPHAALHFIGGIIVHTTGFEPPPYTYHLDVKVAEGLISVRPVDWDGEPGYATCLKTMANAVVPHDNVVYSIGGIVLETSIAGSVAFEKLSDTVCMFDLGTNHISMLRQRLPTPWGGGHAYRGAYKRCIPYVFPHRNMHAISCSVGPLIVMAFGFTGAARRTPLYLLDTSTGTISTLDDQDSTNMKVKSGFVPFTRMPTAGNIRYCSLFDLCFCIGHRTCLLSWVIAALWLVTKPTLICGRIARCLTFSARYVGICEDV